jgi:flagellar biosynthesis protein
MKSDDPTLRQRQAIALLYDGEGAPRITASASGALAVELVTAARNHGIPLYEDAELAALLSQLDLDSEIPPELYLTIAEILAFAWWLLGKQPDLRPDNSAKRCDDQPTSCLPLLPSPPSE